MRNYAPKMHTQTEEIQRPISRLMRSHEAAAYLGVTVRTFQKWVASGAQIPCVLTGKRRRYVAERLEDWKLGRDRRVI